MEIKGIWVSEDVWLEIFNYIGWEDLFNVNLVCSVWSVLSWRAQRHVNLCPFFRKLNDQKLLYVLQRLQEVRVLNLKTCYCLTSNALDHLTHLRKLQRLIISDGLFSDYEPIAKKINRIRSVELTIRRPMDEGKMYHFSRLTNLKSLICYNCSALGDDGFQCLSSLTNLVELVMWDIQTITTTNFKTLLLLTRLRKLDLSGTRSFEQTDLGYLTSLTRLTSLTLARCQLDTLSLMYLSRLTSLQELVLSYNPRINESILWHYITCFTKLRRLELISCGISKSKYYKGLFTVLESIKDLKIVI
jgi:Leucine-rich repeat (LRR) protein